VPSYVRKEIKKKTGVEVDSYGNVLENEKISKDNDDNRSPHLLSNKVNLKAENDKKFKPIKDYKPLGSLIYNEELLAKLENKLK
jgi:hypothetical protein